MCVCVYIAVFGVSPLELEGACSGWSVGVRSGIRRVPRCADHMIVQNLVNFRGKWQVASSNLSPKLIFQHSRYVTTYCPPIKSSGSLTYHQKNVDRPSPLIYIWNIACVLLVFTEGTASVLISTTPITLLCSHQGLKHLHAPGKFVHIDSSTVPFICSIRRRGDAKAALSAQEIPRRFAGPFHLLECGGQILLVNRSDLRPPGRSVILPQPSAAS